VLRPFIRSKRRQAPWRGLVSAAAGPADVAVTGRLTARARAGNAAAMEELARRLACVPAFVRNCNRRLGGPLTENDLDDVTQNVFAAIWAKLERFDGRHDLEGWAFGFCSREVLTAIRARKRARGLPFEDAADVEVAREPAPGAPGELDLVEREIHDLGPPESDIVRLKHFDEASFPEIATALGMPLGSVKTHYYRAVGRLRVRLAALWRALQ